MSFQYKKINKKIFRDKTYNFINVDSFAQSYFIKNKWKIDF